MGAHRNLNVPGGAWSLCEHLVQLQDALAEPAEDLSFPGKWSRVKSSLSFLWQE